VTLLKVSYNTFKQVKSYEKMSDVMIDIETWSTAPNATILTIGAIKFDRKGGFLKPMGQYETFYVRVDPQSCEAIGCYTDPNTVKWWKNQSRQAQYEAIENPDKMPITEALTKLSKWIGNSRYIWANSPSFDCVILESAYERCGLEIPWKFWNTRDCRTIFDLSGIRKNTLPAGNEHYAVADCYRQIVGVKRALKKLGF
jgi:hypothetical protein